MLTKADRTKQLIIEKASHLFNIKGYSGTSMNDIMEATGLAKGGLYGNFKSKEQLAVLAFEHAMNKVMIEMSIKIKQQDNAISKLEAVCDYYKNYTIKSPTDGGCPMINIGSEADDTNIALKIKVKESMNIMLDSLVKIIESGKSREQINGQINSRECAECLFSQIEGGIMMAKTMGEPKILNRILDALKLKISKDLSK